MPWQDVGKSCGDRHSALQGGFFAHVGSVAVDGTVLASLLTASEAAVHQSFFCVFRHLPAFGAKAIVCRKRQAMICPTIKAYHRLDSPYFSAYAGRQRGVGNHSVTSSSTSTVRVTFRTAPVALAAPRKIASFRSIVKRRNFPGMRKSFVPALLRASLSVIHCSAR